MESPREKVNREMRSGLYALLILKTIKDKKKSYGYEIVKYIEEKSRGNIKIKDASIYPILRFFSKRGILKSFWTEPSLGLPRKYYKLTSEGEKLLKNLIEDYKKLKKYADMVLEGGEDK